MRKVARCTRLSLSQHHQQNKEKMTRWFGTERLNSAKKRLQRILQPSHKNHIRAPQVQYSRPNWWKNDRLIRDCPENFGSDLRIRNSSRWPHTRQNCVRDQKPRYKVKRLLRENDLSLLKAIDICRAAEVSREQVQSLSDKTPANIDAVHKDGQRHLPYTPPRGDSTRERPRNPIKKTCGNCGRFHQPK